MAKNNIKPLNQDLFFHKCILTPNITKNFGPMCRENVW